LHGNDPFVGQIIPARDCHRHRDTEALCGLDVVDLIRIEVHERCYYDDVRRQRRDGLVDLRIRWDGGLDDSQK
jgi:hypothetical protein